MRIETVMLSVRVTPRQLDDLKRIETKRVYYTRSKLIKEALDDLSKKYPPDDDGRSSPLFSDDGNKLIQVKGRAIKVKKRPAKPKKKPNK